MPHRRPVTHHTASTPGGLLKWPPSVVAGNCTKGAESCGGAHFGGESRESQGRCDIQAVVQFGLQSQ